MSESVVLRNQFITKCFHIPCYVWIGILVDRYSGSRMRYEYG